MRLVSRVAPAAAVALTPPNGAAPVRARATASRTVSISGRLLVQQLLVELADRNDVVFCAFAGHESTSLVVQEFTRYRQKEKKLVFFLAAKARSPWFT